MYKMLQENTVAIYCRLSREDGDSIESSSIKTQKEMLTEYATCKNWSIFNVYVDDGYSGGNFNRPAFKQMISDIEKGHINIVITKDLSRLGRNYILSGYYIEEYFPKKNIRYIAINDNYDSINGEDDMAPFKSIFNQYYLRDISKKVKSAHHNRIKKGLLPGDKVVPLFGYKNVNGKREIEEQSAMTVKLIFDLYNSGYMIHEIKDYLYNNKIINISYYNYQNYNYNPSVWINASEDKKYIWNRIIIGRILSNEEYTGKTILLKKKTISYKTHERVLTSKDERHVFNDSPAIVSQEEFDKVAIRKKMFCNAPLSNEVNRFKGLVYCGNCHKPLSAHTSKSSSTRKNDSIKYLCKNKNCDKHIAVNINKIEKSIYELSQNMFNLLNNFKEEIKKYAKNYNPINNDSLYNSYINELKTLEDRNEQLNHLIQNLFERNITGEIPKQTYEKILNNYKNELQSNSYRINEITSQLDNKPSKIDYLEEFNKLLERIDNKQLDIDTIKCFIEKIEITRVDKKLKYKLSIYKISKMIGDFINEKQI